jgi:hypothetical protein
MGRCWHAAERYAEAIDAFERIEISAFQVNVYMAACYHPLDRRDRAKLYRDRTLQ